MKYNELLEIDETDKQIISLLQEDPEMDHEDIAKKVMKSVPAVGARVIKLSRKHLLGLKVGAEFREVEVKLARIDVSAKNGVRLWDKFNACPYITNCFKMTGEFNLTIEIVAANIQTIDKFVDNCLRKDENITAIRTNIVIDALKQYLVPLSFEIEKFEEHGCSYDCWGNIGKKDLLEILESKTG